MILFPRLMLHACTLTRTTSLSYRSISLSYRSISLSYALFHFPCVILIEQQFSPYIFEGVFMHRTITTIIYLQDTTTQGQSTSRRRCSVILERISRPGYKTSLVKISGQDLA